MILLIDIGNSRIKACYIRDHEFIDPVAQEYEPESFSSILADIFTVKPTQVFVASVAGDQIKQELVNWCKTQWQLPARFVSVTKQFDEVINAYDDTQQLGVDRWVSLLAARQISKRYTLIVSCGTATTLDAIAINGHHLGGMIIPGLKLMQSCLIANTQEIRPVISDQQFDDSIFGTNTLDCLQKGACASIVALIENVYHTMQEQYQSDVDCIISGGFANVLLDKMTIEYNHQPHLVLMGLDYWRRKV